MATSRTRWAVTAGSAGLAAGLALGVTGLSSAASPSPSPDTKAKQRLDRPFKDFRHELKRGMRGEGGLVSSISGNTLTVRTHGGTKTVTLNGSTTYYTGQTKASKSAVHVGDVVHVRLVDPKATKPVAAVITVLPAHLDGWVTKVDGSTIIVTDPGGFTRTITTSGSTTYVKDGATATASAITVGTFIRAVGQVDDNGTSLDATRIATGHPAKGEHHMGGPGMPGVMAPDMRGDDLGDDLGGMPNA